MGAGKLQPILDEKAIATAALLEKVAADKDEAGKVQHVVGKDAAEVQNFQQEVQAIADDAKADLAEALPVLESAVKSLNALNKNDIVEMKSFTKPPPLVMLTMEAVCTLRQEKPDWDTAKRLMSDTNFMDSLRNFDKENIPDSIIKKLKRCVCTDDRHILAFMRSAIPILCNQTFRLHHGTAIFIFISFIKYHQY
jgi:dynein heavy chain, axonemal